MWFRSVLAEGQWPVKAKVQLARCRANCTLHIDQPKEPMNLVEMRDLVMIARLATRGFAD